MEFNVGSWTFGVIGVFPGVWCESYRLLPHFYLYVVFSQRKAARKPLLLAPFVTEACCGLNNFLESCGCVTPWFWHDWFMLSCSKFMCMVVMLYCIIVDFSCPYICCCAWQQVPVWFLLTGWYLREWGWIFLPALMPFNCKNKTKKMLENFQTVLSCM